jgi:hypothetical protein
VLAPIARGIAERRKAEVSGYNKETGVFQLTQTKAHAWCLRPDVTRMTTMEDCAALLREAGLEVQSVHARYLDVKAKPSQVWEALSGQPSDPSRATYYRE